MLPHTGREHINHAQASLHGPMNAAMLIDILAEHYFFLFDIFSTVILILFLITLSFLLGATKIRRRKRTKKTIKKGIKRLLNLFSLTTGLLTRLHHSILV